MSDDELLGRIISKCSTDLQPDELRGKLGVTVSDAQWNRVFFKKFIKAGGKLGVSASGNIIITACPVAVAVPTGLMRPTPSPATKKGIIDRIDEMLEDQLSKADIRDVLSALEDVIVEELVDKKVDKFSISRVLTIEVDRRADPTTFSMRPLSRLKDV